MPLFDWILTVGNEEKEHEIKFKMSGLSVTKVTFILRVANVKSVVSLDTQLAPCEMKPLPLYKNSQIKFLWWVKRKFLSFGSPISF